MRVGCVTVCLLTGRRKRAGVRVFLSLGMKQSCGTPAAFLGEALSPLLCLQQLLCSAWHTHLGFKFKYTPSVKMSRVFPPWLRWDPWHIGDSLSAMRNKSLFDHEDTLMCTFYFQSAKKDQFARNVWHGLLFLWHHAQLCFPLIILGSPCKVAP